MDTIISEENITLINEYKTESFAHFANIEKANEQLKEIIEAAFDKTGVEKKYIAAFFKAEYKAKMDDEMTKNDVLRQLSRRKA